MATHVRDQRIESKAARAALKPSPKPYYRSLGDELHIGYRKPTSSSRAGKWVVRYYLGNGVYKVETFATADDIGDANGVNVLDYRQAQGKARELRDEAVRTLNGVSKPAGPYTVADAVRDYLDWLGTHRKSERDFRYRADAHILPELGETEVARLTADQLRGWQKKLSETPPRLRTAKGAEKPRFREIGDDPESKRQRRVSANRVLVILKAALNYAWREGKVLDDSAWRRVEPFANAEATRARWLTVDEARRLINACEDEFRDLVQGALATGCRYGELAAFSVDDYNPDAGTIHVRASKSGRGRHIYLNDEGRALFDRLTAGKPADAPIFRRPDGGRWLKSHQLRPFNEACERAGIVGATFHCLRHTFASLSIMAGAPLIVVAKNLGHSDTRMVEKHYGHLADKYVAETMRAAAPSFGLNPGNVAPLRQGVAS